ncbi:LysR family transcriptional regulator [Salipiger sp. PrR002]|uniref:LysR family transcriptional regulator n=1 Tax=Salipiger sp. PrR002 TaxID=2706489 RepID=UPI0013BBFB2C|nr:LysR family transcriptional regulator [Salipiger sp. PrR002]NDW00632.1 LysR family transcriptional regulator [Salipiger sp. PrR002]NDW57773.1 LysR family transcriptional regulator [Salipiger sp. PrR004]
MDWTSLPPLPALRAFAAYAETGSVQRAGAALNVSHAAISQQIRNLESHLGLGLLDRSRRSMALTEEGARLAQALSDGFGRIAQELSALTGAEAERPLMITTTPSFASSWLMPRLARFREAHPEISLMIDPSAKVAPLEPGGVDLALRYGSGQWPGLEAELLVESPIALVGSPRLVGEREISDPSDLTEFHWLQELGTNEASEWFSQFGIDRDARRGISSLPGNLMLEAARQGHGIAITARVFADDDIAAGRLRLLFEDTRKKGYYLVIRPGVMRPPLRLFATWLRREAAKAK